MRVRAGRAGSAVFVLLLAFTFWLWFPEAGWRYVHSRGFPRDPASLAWTPEDLRREAVI
jgi:hypothetical protein